MNGFRWIFLVLLLQQGTSSDNSWKSTLLVTKPEAIRQRYNGKILREVSLLHEGRDYDLNFQQNLASITTECSQLPLFPDVDECVRMLSNSSFILFLNSILLIRRVPIQSVIFSAPLELLPGVIVRVTTPIDSSNPDELVLWTCQSLLNQFQLSFSLNECLENGRFVLQRELVRRENKISLHVAGHEISLSFQPSTTSPLVVARNLCSDNSELLSITSGEGLATCVFPVKHFLEKTYYTVDEIYRWSFEQEAIDSIR